MIAENYWGLQSERARGLPFVTFGSAVRHWNEKLVVAPGIRALDDLRGKTLALRTPGPQELLPKLWLQDRGLAGDVATKLYTDPEEDGDVTSFMTTGRLIPRYYLTELKVEGLDKIDPLV